MSSQRDEELLARLSTTAEAIDSLRELFAAEEPLDTVLTRVARTAVDAIPDANAVSITVVAGDDDAEHMPRTAAHTDERLLRLDHAQYRSGRGPCLEAAERRVPVRVAMEVAVQRWPEFVAVARDEGVRASLSVPLLIDLADQVGQELVGSINVYGCKESAFDPFDEKLMSLFTQTASHAITNSRRWQQSRDTVTQLERALTSRAEIDQAKGVLRAVHGYTAKDAFNALLNESQRRNIKLRTIARELLDSLSTRSPAPPPNNGATEEETGRP